MSSPDEIRAQIQKVLDPYIVPREEAAFRRRILAAHLQSSVKDGSLSSPLALAQPSRGVNIHAEACGLHREYLKALNANISARSENDKVKDELSRRPKSGSEVIPSRTGSSDLSSLSPLEEHLIKIKLQRKQARLQTVEKHIALLAQKPAASPSFLDPEEIFAGTRPLPSVPREVVEGLSLDASPGKANLADLIDRLEKQVLRAKLLLKNEEKLLNTVKARSTVRPESVTDAAKLAALNATRTELINWMEAELGKVPGEEDDQDEIDTDGASAQDIETSQLDSQLSTIKSKYAAYLSTRKQLLQLVSQSPSPSSLPPPTASTTSTSSPQTTVPHSQPITYLLTPTLSTLLSLSRTQKGLITQKSHLNTTISRSLKETGQLLDHLAEESNLLVAHPLPGSASTSRVRNNKLGLGGLSETVDTQTRVRPWVYAAEESKIATLEKVAEKIEEGQVALEGSMRVLMEVEGVLGRKDEREEERTGKGEGGEEREREDSDIWLAEEKGEKGRGRRHVVREKGVKGGKGSDDLWAFLDGSLGGLRGKE